MQLACAACSVLVIAQPSRGAAQAEILGQASTEPLSLAQEKTYHFDLEVDDLSKELIHFTEFTKQRLFFDSTLVRGLQGQAVKGDLALMEGLLILVKGTGLSAHIVGGGITLTPSKPASERGEAGVSSSGKNVNLGVLSIESNSITVDDQSDMIYAGKVASQVRAAVTTDKNLAAVEYDVAAEIWLDPSGRIIRVQLPPKSGEEDVYREIALTLDHLAIKPSPPANFPGVSIRIVSAER